MRNEDIGIDLEKVIKYTNIYQNSVGVRCQVITTKGETVYDTSDGCDDCRFCRRVEKSLARICRTHTSTEVTRPKGLEESMSFSVPWAYPLGLPDNFRGFDEAQ